MDIPTMTDSSGVTICDLLPSTFRQVDVALQRERATNVDLAKANLPDCDVFDILAQAWAKARELHEFADEAKHPPGEVSTMFLGEHALTGDVHPTVTVAVGPARFSLRFTLELEAAFRMAELTIKNKHITELGKCDCEVSAVLKYDDVPLHEPLKSKQVNLTSSMVFAAPGVPIF
jgi:hypothetical protein